MLKNIRLINKKIIFLGFLGFLAIAERLWWDLGPNVELVTTATILATLILGRSMGVVVALVILGLTDIFLGNTQIMLFTWSAFILEALAVFWLAKKIKFGQLGWLKKIFSSAGFGIGASFWFYLWTNFGVWLLGSWGMYPKTLAGLFFCYLTGLPFLKLNLFSNLVFVPATLLIWQIINLKSFGFSFFGLKIVDKGK